MENNQNQQSFAIQRVESLANPDMASSPRAMEIEQIKSSFLGAIRKIGEFTRNSFQGVRSELNNIQDLGQKLSSDLDHTVSRLEGCDTQIFHLQDTVSILGETSHYMCEE